MLQTWMFGSHFDCWKRRKRCCISTTSSVLYSCFARTQYRSPAQKKKKTSSLIVTNFNRPLVKRHHNPLQMKIKIWWKIQVSKWNPTPLTINSIIFVCHRNQQNWFASCYKVKKQLLSICSSDTWMVQLWCEEQRNQSTILVQEADIWNLCGQEKTDSSFREVTK